MAEWFVTIHTQTHMQKNEEICCALNILIKCELIFFFCSLKINFLLSNLFIFWIPAEALHLAHLMSAHGYLFPIDDHVLTVKNDNTYYRFQVSNSWPLYLYLLFLWSFLFYNFFYCFSWQFFCWNCVSFQLRWSNHLLESERAVF